MHDSYEDDADDDLEDDDYQDDDDTSQDLSECPNCGATIFDDSVACPRCGEYITHSSHPFAGRPWWWLALGALGIIADPDVHHRPQQPAVLFLLFVAHLSAPPSYSYER